VTSDRTQRAIDALTAAWPPLADDPTYAEQLALVALHAAGDPQHLPPGDSAELPRWLVDAIGTLPADQRGAALGFAAAGYVAGRGGR
jgi:hypothetical protein